MTIERGAEIAGTSVVAAATAAGAMTEADMGGWLVPMISVGLAALVGYFTSRITTEREVGTLGEREANHFGEVVRRLERIERKLDDQ
jgi:hypothetical protein